MNKIPEKNYARISLILALLSLVVLAALILFMNTDISDIYTGIYDILNKIQIGDLQFGNLVDIILVLFMNLCIGIIITLNIIAIMNGIKAIRKKKSIFTFAGISVATINLIIHITIVMLSIMSSKD